MLLCLAIIMPIIVLSTVLALCMLRTGSKGECANCGARLHHVNGDVCDDCDIKTQIFKQAITKDY